MKKKLLFIGIAFLLGISCWSQDKTNPIVYAEIFGGYSGGSSSGWTGGLELNYQVKNNLLTGRYIGLTNLKHTSNLFIIPIYIDIENLNEYALLYGKRYIYNNHSISFSSGVSYLDRNFLVNTDYNNPVYEYQKSIGFPFEFDIKWFKRKRERFRIVYGLIPVGKPTSFGRSIGFKFYGDISKTTFVGLGITLGLGWHKKY